MKLTEEELQINQAHRDRMEAASRTYGSLFTIPYEVLQILYELNRREWVDWVKHRDMPEPTERVWNHDKTDKLLEFVRSQIGKLVSPNDLMKAADCSKGTAYAFIATNRGWFQRIGRGAYRVIDDDAERDAAKCATMHATRPAVASKPLASIPTAQDEADATVDVLRRIAGDSPRTPGKE